MLCTKRIDYLGIFLTGMCFVHFSFDLIAQERFSKTSDFADQLVFNDVYITDSGYITTSRAIDSDYSNPYFVTGFDQQGEQISQVIYDSQGWYLEGIFDTDVQLNDSTWVIACERRNDLSDTTYCVLLWMDEMGDTLFSRQFMSPYFNPEYETTAWVRPTAINKSEDGNSLFVVCQIVSYPQLQNGFIVQQYSMDGVKGWTYQSPIDNNYYACNGIVERNDTIYAIKYGGGGTNFPKIISINALTGTFNWQHELDGDQYPYKGTKDILLEEDGIVCASVHSEGTFATVPAIFKVNFEGNYIWQHKRSQYPYWDFQENNHIQKAWDGGYVCCSAQFDYAFISGEESANTIMRIWLWKVDSNGVFQWERFYSYYDFDTDYWDMTNIAHDFKATPDGGFICAGEATVTCVDYPECSDIIQQGWLLKVDGCGCLVEGCDEACTVGANETDDTMATALFRVGPNPASDMLNVFVPTLTTIDIRDAEFRLYDLQGSLVRSFYFPHDNTTYMIDASTLAAGQYVLSLISEGVLLQTEQIIIAR